MQLSEQTSSPTRKIGSAAEVLDGLKPLWSNAQSRSSSLSVERFKIPSAVLPVTPRVQFENQHHVAVVWTGKVKENRRALRSMESPHDTLILPFGLALEECTLSGVGFTDFAVSPSFLRRVARETDLSGSALNSLCRNGRFATRRSRSSHMRPNMKSAPASEPATCSWESLATALAAHLTMARYSSPPTAAPREYRGGLSPYQLRLTRDFIEANLGEDFGLGSTLAGKMFG